MDNSRYIEMCQIQDQLQPEVLKLKEIDCPKLNKNTFAFLKKKLLKPSVRSSFATWMYEYVKYCASKEAINLRYINEPKLFTHVLPFLMEGVISVMYLENQIFDGKGEINNLLKIKNNLVAASLLKDHLYTYINKNIKDEFVRLRITECVRNMFTAVNTCQYIEKNHNCNIYEKSPKGHFQNNPDVHGFINLTTIKPIIKQLTIEFPAKEEAIYFYFIRCYLFSAPMFKLATTIILSLTAYQGKEKENMIAFADIYGILMQLVNDNADFLLDRDTRGKVQKDVLSDLRNFTMTLPTMFHLYNNPSHGLLATCMRKKKFKKIKNKHNLILKELIHSKSLRKSILIGQEMAHIAADFIQYEDKDSAAFYLKNLLSVAQHNRFYRHYYNAKKFYKRKKNEGKIYRCEDNLSPEKIRNTNSKKVLI